MAWFSQSHGIVPLTAQGADATSSLDLDSINMAKYDQVTVCILFAASLVGDNVLTFGCGATDGTKTANATFHYRLGSAAPKATSSDVYAADATSASLTLTAATYQGKLLVCELDAAEMNISDTQYQYLTVNLDGTASTGTVTAWAVMSRPTYAEAVMDSVVV